MKFYFDKLRILIYLLRLSSTVLTLTINPYKIAVIINTNPLKNQLNVVSEYQATINTFIVGDDSQINLTAEIITQSFFQQIPTIGEKIRQCNRLRITQSVICNSMLKNAVAVILVHENYENQDSAGDEFAAIAYALSFYRLPTIGVMIQDAEYSRKNVYPMFLRTSPPYSHEAYVVIKLLKELDYRQVILTTVFGDVNGDEFKTVFEENSKKNKIHVQKYISLHVNESLENNMASHFEETTSNIIILYAKPSKAELIIQAGMKIFGKNKVWIINEKASYISSIPNGFLSIRLREDPKSAFKDALLVIRNAGEYLLTLNATDIPTNDCNSIKENTKWIESVGYNFYKYIIEKKVHGARGEIKFNDKGDRITADYEVLNKKNNRWQTVGNIANNGRLYITEEIEWINGEKDKPQEIHLPEYLRVVTVHDPPFVYTFPVASEDVCINFTSTSITDVEESEWYPCYKRINETFKEIFCCSGLVIDLIYYLSQPEPHTSLKTNFTYELHLNTTYGIPILTDNGYTLSGMIGELDSDMADIAIGALSINAEREKYIDFTEPWLYHGIHIMEKYRPKDSPMESFIQPLKNSLWGALCIIVIGIGCAIYILDYKSPFKKFYDKNENIFGTNSFVLASDDEDNNVTFGEAMWFVWGVLLNSGVCEKTPRSFSARVLGLVWCGFCMIIVASYTANLAAFLVLDQPERGLTGINDPKLRNPSANYSYATVYDTNTYQYFKRHVELSTMFRKMETHNVITSESAINSLLNDTLDAFIWDSVRLEYEASKHCELRTRGAVFGRNGYGIGLQKNSPWTPHITMGILRLSENGKMTELYRKWIENAGKTICEPRERSSPARLGLQNMRDIFILVIIGVLIGCILCIFESIYGQYKTKEQRQSQIARRYAEKWIKNCNFTYPEHETSLCKYSNINLLSPKESFKEKFNTTEHSHSLNTILSYHEMSRQKYINDVLRRKNYRINPTKLIFRNNPTFIYCSRCRALMTTKVKPIVGVFAIICTIIFIILFLWPCALLPIHCTIFADYLHYCSNCNHKIGRYRRGFKKFSKFYV
ncbi:Ionotropic glutamate receptor domain and Extracellular solute-binding protein, family 3 domain and Extracellular ligand-binding receptor domain and LPS-induced tumor necrosis factor alpha factor domain and Periplasmic binding protein-like I domain-containing protein [Strongyloides ratti]|uniref:LITAF domain-containing protein n=1 Tax=Strongyloides ratti TaxID=34506 RepID=A0A090KS72_STRRB|nr:Ionotropic glutamate receptor domain and Extracellular solute-binding protein, family 3 domain and Extracellular ligand-binding receptor domain and LPS-induced tumor necrosis factor alpha factor domain and Periplasmic binding protein-like I domain-containing protein [Strongyloides ratti]CEF60365.1 Ionotropic glutamate receptor domain and Extracellular solute-binding protein, family 3 domain and Extracellular ligand-binding receptor domain and LPS-induced tumor necrosis factor alpha factor domai